MCVERERERERENANDLSLTSIYTRERENANDLSLTCIYTYICMYVRRERECRRLVASKVPAMIALQNACQRMSLYIIIRSRLQRSSIPSPL